MADNRKYYYLKLKENYFDDDSILLLESMQDGILYSYIMLKLYLKSLKHGGRLQLDENIPYTPQMIATITRQQIGTVERAIKIFLQLGLMEQMPDGAFYMSNIELLIGQSSTEGERKRRARQANRAALNPGGQMSAICPPEIEIKRELEIEKDRGLKKDNPHPPLLADIRMFSCLILSWPNCKPISPPSGRSTLSACPSTWRLLAEHTRAMPLPSGAG